MKFFLSISWMVTAAREREASVEQERSLWAGRKADIVGRDPKVTTAVGITLSLESRWLTAAPTKEERLGPTCVRLRPPLVKH